MCITVKNTCHLNLVPEQQWFKHGPIVAYHGLSYKLFDALDGIIDVMDEAVPPMNSYLEC